MPGLDRNGPMGDGPMTGGRRGRCGRTRGASGQPDTGRYGYVRGVGFRQGCGRGRGLGQAYGGYPYPSAYTNGHLIGKTDEIRMLRADADAMRESLEAVQRRIAELEKDGSA